MDLVQKKKEYMQTVNMQTILKQQKQMIYDYAKKNGQITRKEVEDLLGIGTTKAHRLLKELCDEDKMIQSGSGKLSKYFFKHGIDDNH